MLKEAYITKQYYSELPLPEGPYFLSLQVTEQAFMYAISVSDFKRVIELCHVQLTNPANTPNQFNEQIAFLVQHYFLLKKQYAKVNIAFLNHDFNLVPEAFAPENKLKALLNFSTGARMEKSPAAHQIKGLKFSYTVEPELLNYFEKTFVNAVVRHAGAVNICLFFSQHSLANADVMLLINDGSIELGIKHKTDLQFYNIFNYQSNEDILYYLLFTMEQFNLNALHVKLLVAGQRQTNDELVKSLKKYIKHVSFCVHDPSVILSGDAALLPKHYYFTLLNQHLCEL